MPPRKLNPKAPQKHELEAFAEQYDIYKAIYGDPIEYVFQVMSNTDDESTQITAANMLMSYRYPRIKAAEVPSGANSATPLQLNINVMAPPAERVVSPAPVLELKSKLK
jgi:hypothetical protein